MPKNKRSLKRGPFTAKDIEGALSAARCTCRPGGKHMTYSHPTSGRKFAVSRSWTNIQAGDPVFRNLRDFLDLSKDELLILLNGEKPKSEKPKAKREKKKKAA